MQHVRRNAQSFGYVRYRGVDPDFFYGNLHPSTESFLNSYFQNEIQWIGVDIRGTSGDTEVEICVPKRRPFVDVMRLDYSRIRLNWSEGTSATVGSEYASGPIAQLFDMSQNTSAKDSECIRWDLESDGYNRIVVARARGYAYSSERVGFVFILGPGQEDDEEEEPDDDGNGTPDPICNGTLPKPITTAHTQVVSCISGDAVGTVQAQDGPVTIYESQCPGRESLPSVNSIIWGFTMPDGRDNEVDYYVYGMCGDPGTCTLIENVKPGTGLNVGSPQGFDRNLTSSDDTYRLTVFAVDKCGKRSEFFDSAFYYTGPGSNASICDTQCNLCSTYAACNNCNHCPP